jgi:hypothetical protein
VKLVEALCYKPECCGFDSIEVIEFFSIYLILTAALGPGVYSASNRNEYQKQKKMILESKERPEREAGTPSPGAKRPGRQADQLLPTSTQLKYTRIYTITLLYAFVAKCLVSQLSAKTTFYIIDTVKF